MESVLKKIRDARAEDCKRRAETNSYETVVDGCQVRVRFDPRGNSAVLPAVKNMLISAHLETVMAGGIAA